MKSTYLASLTCAALLFTCTTAFADDAGNHTGMSTHPDFDKVDVKHHGYLTSADVRNDDWVSKNFAQCNVKHDGHMSREEYANCHE